jgi:RND superfamily putative drug exporter
VLVLLLVLFGGVVAAGLPVVVALVGVAGTLGTLSAVSLVLDVSVYSVNIVTMLGLGLAVDYALLLVARFREERAVDPDVQGALERTLATAAGRSCSPA